MSQITLDPIAYSEALQAAGMPKAQADVIARTWQASLDKIEAREPAIIADLRELEKRLAAKIDQCRRDTLKWIFGMFLAFGAALIAILK